MSQSAVLAIETSTVNPVKSRASLKQGGGKTYSDPEFDDKQPVEVIQMMSRAKAWLESRGYSITLKGEYREVKIRTVKF